MSAITAVSGHPHGPHVLIVAGLLSFLVRALPRLLCLAGARVSLAAPPGQSMRHSAYLEAWIPLSPDRGNWGQEVSAHLASHPGVYDRVIVSEESLIEAFAREQPDLPWLPWSRPEDAAMFASRSAFFRRSIELGLAVPRGRICRTLAEAIAFVRENGPSFLKRDGSVGGGGVHRVSEASEIEDVFKALPMEEEIVIQQECVGPVGITELVLHRGQVLGWAASFKHRTFYQNGPSCSRKFEGFPGMEEIVRQFAAATGFSGPCGFDWIQSADGAFHVLEFHPRPSSGFGLATLAGVDFPSALRAWVEDRVIDPVCLPADTVKICHHFPDHPLTALKQRRWREFVDWIPFTPAASWATLPWTDLPFLFRQLTKFGQRSSKP